jgi:ubiquinol-cytochrome c reductase cytochrome c1 subunit
MRKIILGTLAAGLVAFALPALAEEGPALEHQAWPWLGMFGKFDQAQLKRGFQVYHDVCSNCHSLKLVAYRNLAALGFSEDEIKNFAAEKTVKDGPNDQGEMFDRPARPSDRFVPPFPNDQAARSANNGALPPDLSLMEKARKGGPDYVHAVLTGFRDAPEGFTLNEGMYYNTAFPGNQIAMPPPLADEAVTYADGTKATLEQESKDIVAFLTWTAEPELDVRHSLGIKVLGFLVVLTALFYALKRKIWSDVEH